MLRAVFQELFLGPDPIFAAQMPTYRFGSFFFDNLISTTCFGISSGLFIKMWRKKPDYLADKDPTYIYPRNRNNLLPDSLHALLSDTGQDLNHISDDFLKYGFMPYTFIHRDDYRLGESEWTYAEIEAPSLINSSGHINDVFGQDSIEFEFFKKTLWVCGRFPKSHLKAMYRYVTVLNLEPMQLIMEIGDSDDFMFIIIDGEIEVVILDESRNAKTLRIAKRGDRVYSLFSLIDVLTGHSKPLKSVEAFAKTKSKVLKFPILVLKDYLHQHSARFPCVISKIIHKIYEQNFLVLHRILGLTFDMVNQTSSPKIQNSENISEDSYLIPIPSEVVPDEIRADAIRSLMQFLGITDESVLEGCSVFVLDPRSDSSHELIAVDDDCYKFKYVFKGQVEMYRLKSGFQESLKDNLEVTTHESLFTLGSGEGVGGLTTLAGKENFLFMNIIKRSVIVAMSESVLGRLLDEYPETVLHIANQIVVRISPLIRKLDFGMQWTAAEGGRALFITGNEVRDTFIVLGGRLRSYMINAKGKLIFYGEYERGNWVGLIEALVRFPIRSKTVIAVRYTEVCKIPMDLISYLKETFPSAAFSLLGYVAHRVGKFRFQNKSMNLSPEEQLITGTSRRCASLALIPTSEDVPYVPFAKEIKKHHDVYGTTAVVSWYTFQDTFQLESIDDSHAYIVERWITSILEHNDLVIFVCSERCMYWSEICIDHAELVISLGLQGDPISATSIEKMMIKRDVATRKRKELIILHKTEQEQRPSRYALPRDTIAWLEQRPWINMHHHIRIPAEAFDFTGLVSQSELDLHYKALKRPIFKHSDMSRFCRWIIGKSVGIVFTGGGSRMAAQVGVLKAMVDHDIPIDMVGGVGTGLIVAAFYSIYESIEKTTNFIEQMFYDIAHASRTTFDLTIPYISPIQGRAMLAMVEKFFARTRMEDAWVPFFGVTCDITKQNARVHRDGPFWVYVRASLSNFLGCPPICDPKDGGYIVDGSFANPVPEDVMRDFGAEYVLVINAAIGKTFEAPRFDPTKDIFTNLWRVFLVLASRLNFLTPDFVRINDMLGRTQKFMYAEAVEANTDGLFVAFIKPDTELFASEVYKNFKRLHTVGYAYAKRILDRSPVRGIPFHEFWMNLRTNSATLETDQGRGLKTNINDEFWDIKERRLFQRDDTIEAMKIDDLKAKLGKNFRGNFINQEAYKEELKKDKEIEDFKKWVLNREAIK